MKIDMTKLELDERYIEKIKEKCNCGNNLEILVTKEAEPSMWFPDSWHHYYYTHCKHCKTISNPYFPDDPKTGLTDDEIKSLKNGMCKY